MTKLFDFIHHHGCEISTKRALSSDPDFAERHAARRTTPGIILGSTGPGGLDGYFADLTFTHQFRPWWHTATLHIHWWLGKHGPSAQHRRLKNYHQRGIRGFSDEDVWNLHIYLATIIRDSVKFLNETKYGWPGDPLTYDEWTQILTEISDGMQAHLDLYDLEPIRKHEERVERVALISKQQLAFTHLSKWFSHLWD